MMGDSDEIINVGTGIDLSIKDLALLIKDCIGYEGDLFFNSDYPDGTRENFGYDQINDLGWVAKKELADGVSEVYYEYANQATNLYELSTR